MTGVQEITLINLGLNRSFVGFYLVRRLGKSRCTWEELATSLGLTVDRMVQLAWCKTPRSECYEKDIIQIADHFGIREDLLIDLIEEKP